MSIPAFNLVEYWSTYWLIEQSPLQSFIIERKKHYSFLVTERKKRRIYSLITCYIENWMFRNEIEQGKAATLDIMLENSGGRCTRTLLHPPSMEASPWQSQVFQCRPRPRFRGMCHRLLPLRPHQFIMRQRGPELCGLQSPRNSEFQPRSHNEVGCVRIWNIVAGACGGEDTIAAAKCWPR